MHRPPKAKAPGTLSFADLHLASNASAPNAHIAQPTRWPHDGTTLAHCTAHDDERDQAQARAGDAGCNHLLGGTIVRFAKLMATPLGRLVRVGAGGILVYVGLGRVRGIAGSALAIAGLLPLAAGVFNYCTIAPLIGAPFWGKDARHEHPQGA